MFRSKVAVRLGVDLVLLLLATRASYSQALRSLMIAPVSAQSEYCQETDSKINLNLRVLVEYVNTGAVQVILPKFACVRGYKLFRVEGDLPHRVETDVVYRKSVLLDTSKLNFRSPSQDLFDLIPAGEKVNRVFNIRIPLDLAEFKDRSLLGANHYLEMTIDHWPGSYRPGKKLAGYWKSIGVLWMTKGESQPFKFYIERHPAAVRCAMRVD